MDKLELDARVARVERCYALILILHFAIPATVLLLLVGYARMGGAEHTMGATVVAAPIPPTPTEWVEAVQAPFVGRIVGGMASPDSIAGLYQELATLKQLKDEGVISEADWQAKKEQVLVRQLNPGDLRTNLSLVQKLIDAGSLTEAEQASLRRRLLGLEEPKAEDKPGF